VSYHFEEWRDLSDSDVAEKARTHFGAAEFEMQRRLLIAMGDLRSELVTARKIALVLVVVTVVLLFATIGLAVEAALLD
jgi:hypothetical protein